MTGRKIQEQSKALKAKYFGIRQGYSKHEIRLGYSPTDKNHADINTKVNLTQERFDYHFDAYQNANPKLDCIQWR